MIVPYLGLLVLVRGIGCDCVFLCGAFSCVVCVCVWRDISADLICVCVCVCVCVCIVDGVWS